MMYEIGVIGNGFVGNAVAKGLRLSDNHKLYVYDIDDERTECSWNDIVHRTNMVFVCVPTPMMKNGRQDITYVTSVLKKLSSENYSGLVIIKSTVVPGTTDSLQQLYGMRIVFNPEFLTERNAEDDFIVQRIVIGGDDIGVDVLKRMYEDWIKNRKVAKNLDTNIFICTDSKSAEMIKYLSNVFLAVKVSFANEARKMADEIGANWDDIVEGVTTDNRIGPSHFNVPGHDGYYGFGGSCFPKDINALIHFAKDCGIYIPTIEGAWTTNLLVRPERDWEELEGRAVSNINVNI